MSNNFLTRALLPVMAPHMRSPGSGPLGWLAMKFMELGNQSSIKEGVERLQLERGEIFVELGAAHGVGLRSAFPHRPKRIVCVEISPNLRTKLEAVKKDLMRTTTATTSTVEESEDQNQNQNQNENSIVTSIEIYGDDCRDMSAFLQDESVDKIFAMNVVYFLDPLDTYMKELNRVLKKGGIISFGCKFEMVKEDSPPFFNTEREAIVGIMKKAHFEVKVTEIDLGYPMYNYTELRGKKI